jgi:hypothetical protein
MRIYSSFLIRCWLTDDASPNEQAVLQAEHIQTGTSMRGASLVELEPWLFEACRNALSKDKKATRSEQRENREQNYDDESDIQSER